MLKSPQQAGQRQRYRYELGYTKGTPSPQSFNTVICTLIEALRPYRHLRYTFSNSKHTIHLLQYADDTCLISNGPASCQELIKHVEKWLQWTWRSGYSGRGEVATVDVEKWLQWTWRSGYSGRGEVATVDVEKWLQWTWRSGYSGRGEVATVDVEKWLQWTGMQTKPVKCHSLAIKASSRISFDPALTIRGQSIPFISNQAIKFLGKVIQVPLDNNNIKSQVLQKLTRMLERVDESEVTRQQELRLYQVGICPRLAWDLTINTLPISWVRRKLEATATRFLKKWSGLAKCADTDRLYLPQAQGGLGLPSFSLLYQKHKCLKPASCQPQETQL